MDVLLLIDSVRDGAQNMAIDVAMARMVGEGYLPFTVRLYGWMKPTLSLGRSQSLDDVNLDFVKKEGIDIVRRPTGGMAVLHDSEITFCFCIPGDHPWNRLGSQEIHLKVSRLLCEALRILEIPVNLHERQSDHRFPLCYATTSRFEITLHGKKLVGSAQYRTKHFVLQHGSIPTKLDLERYLGCFKNPGLSSEELKNRTISLSEIGIHLDHETFATAMYRIMEEMNLKVEVSHHLPDLVLRHADDIEDLYRLS